MPEIVNVSTKLDAFWADRKEDPQDWSILTEWEMIEVQGVPAVVASCSIRHLGADVAHSSSLRAVRAPLPGADGSRDPRDLERAQTAAVGRALSYLGYAMGESLEPIEGEQAQPNQAVQPQQVQSADGMAGESVHSPKAESLRQWIVDMAPNLDDEAKQELANIKEKAGVTSLSTANEAQLTVLRRAVEARLPVAEEQPF